MRWRRCCSFALAAAVLPAGCASPDYSAARQSRFDRPYRGGAAAVTEVKPVDESPPATPLDLFAFVAAIGLMASRNVDHGGSRPAETPVTVSPR